MMKSKIKAVVTSALVVAFMLVGFQNIGNADTRKFDKKWTLVVVIGEGEGELEPGWQWVYNCDNPGDTCWTGEVIAPEQ